MSELAAKTSTQVEARTLAESILAICNLLPPVRRRPVSSQATNAFALPLAIATRLAPPTASDTRVGAFDCAPSSSHADVTTGSSPVLSVHAKTYAPFFPGE